MSRRQLARKAAFKPPKSKLFVFSEGAVTEPLYLHSIAKKFSGAAISIEKCGGAPRTLVSWAKTHQARMKRTATDFTKNDSVWVVFDRDDHPSITQALAEVHAAGIGIAYSNPCFEIWLIYHFADHNAPATTAQAKERIATLTSDYCSRSQKLLAADCFLDKLDAAMRRSRQSIIDREKEGAALSSPCSTFHDLIDAISRMSSP